MPALVLLFAISSLQPAWSNATKSLHQLKSLLGTTQFRQVEAFTQLRQPEVDRWLYVSSLKSVIGYYPDGQIAIMLEMDGRRVDGSCTAYYKSGAVEWEGSFENGHPSGVWKRYFPNSQLHVQLTTNASKKLAYLLALRQQNPKLSFSREAIYALKHKGALPTQHHLLQTLSPQFRQFLFLHGDVTEYYPNGQVKSEAWFSNNLPSERWTSYSSSGLITQQGYYHLGYKHGAWKYFDEQGELLRMTEYKQGKAAHVTQMQQSL